MAQPHAAPGIAPRLPGDEASPTLQVNGQRYLLPPDATLAALIEQLGYSGTRLAVERNGDIVPRSRHAETVLLPGDVLEVVVAIGGG